MTTTRSDIDGWFDRGVEQGYKYMLVICDTYDHEDYPSYARTAEDCVVKHKNPGAMQRVMEVYDLSMDKLRQLNEHRAMHVPETGKSLQEQPQ